MTLKNSLTDKPLKNTPPKKPKRDGADEEARKIIVIAKEYTPLGAEEEIAKRLRAIAQGPRKWGILR